MPYYSIDELRRIITPIASAHGVESVSVFGSYSKGNATADSGIDLKIEKGQICRSGDGFILRQASSVSIFDNVSQLKRYWNKNISPLPSIVKNQLSRIADPALSGAKCSAFLCWSRQEGYIKHCQSRFFNHGFYNKQDLH